MTRAELEALIADYLDGTLDEAQLVTFERYLPVYPDLVELVNDAREAMGALDALETPEPPQALYARIHLSLEAERGAAKRKRRSTGMFQSLAAFFAPMLQPRLAMGMAMTVLSISMVGQLLGTRIDQIGAEDLKPSAIWSTVQYRAERIWDRTAKYYESLRVVYEMRTRVQEWQNQLQQERDRAASRLEDPETEIAPSDPPEDGAANPGTGDEQSERDNEN